MTSNEQERKHHPFSPSTLANREACPCFKGRNEANAAAIAGTLAHKAVEERTDDNELTDEQALRVADCLDFYDKRVALMQEARQRAIGLAPTITAKRKVKPVVELAEKYWRVDTVKDPRFKTKETTGGFADAFVIDHTETYAEGFDWKFGMWSVEDAAENVQGWSYVIGFFREHQKVQKVLFWFFQPAIERITSHLFHRSDIPAHYLRIQAIVERAKTATLAADTGNYDLATPKVPACNFCDRIGQCPKVLNLALRVSKKYMPIEFPESISANTIMDPKNASLALRLAQVVKIWSEGFRATTTDRVVRGDAEVPEGYTFGTGQRREIVSLPKFKEIALRYMTEAEYHECLSVEFGPIEKKIQDAAPRGSKKASLESFQELLASEGATEKGTPYTFLRVKTASKETETNNTQPKVN